MTHQQKVSVHLDSLASGLHEIGLFIVAGMPPTYREKAFELSVELTKFITEKASVTMATAALTIALEGFLRSMIVADLLPDVIDSGTETVQ